jgi:ParB-like chromosome segregation protein Spo0J
MTMTELRPSQNEINEDRVLGVIKSIKNGSIGKNPLVVSEDGYIVDGHHRWAAYKKYSPEKRLPVLVIELSIQDALGLATTVSSDREKF